MDDCIEVLEFSAAECTADDGLDVEVIDDAFYEIGDTMVAEVEIEEDDLMS